MWGGSRSVVGLRFFCGGQLATCLRRTFEVQKGRQEELPCVRGDGF